MNPYNILESYGRASFDVRNRFFLAGTWNLPHRFSLSPFLVTASGAPFNVTLGQDLFGTGVFNARPAFAPAGASGPNIVATSLGTFKTAPQAGQALIPSNYFAGPGQFTLNLRLSKTFAFGKEVSRQRVHRRWRWVRRRQRWRRWDGAVVEVAAVALVAAEWAAVVDGAAASLVQGIPGPSATTSPSAPMHATS